MIEKRIINFDLKMIKESGQCFRMKEISDDKYCLVAMNRYLEIEKIGLEAFRFSCSQEEFDSVWEEYFDLKTDYSKFISNVDPSDEFLTEAVKYGSGIRILKQDTWEMIVTFIISQRKSIPSIKNIVERLCVKYGDEKECNGFTYYTFPSYQVLGVLELKDFQDLGMGYRDKYILKAARDFLYGEIDLEYLNKASYEDAFKELCNLYGVGIKVANCVLLFGLYHIDAFPIDTWIERIINIIYDGNFPRDKYKGYEGIIQQYMFYYARGINLK
ncbi:MAG: 8-oxoguanine DNA glycosylase [Clostridiales bacterium]|nr:8-oxoguanine DNA glycosylase [Clostridiales bacterium]